MHRTALHIFRSKTICWLRTTGIRGSGKSSVARLERKLIFIAELRYKRLHVPASVAAAGQGGCTVTYCSGNSTAAIGDYKIALVEGNTEDSVVTFQNDDKEILSGTRTMGEGLTLTVAAEAEEGQETEQEAVIEKLLADAVITDTAPATTVFGETVKDDVVIEADDGYLQLQMNDNTVLVSTFSFNYDKNVFSKTLNLPGGLTVRYGNVQDKETGYIPFVSTVNNRNIKILATSVEALQGFFQG